MVCKRVKGFDLGTEPPHVQLSREAPLPPPPAIMIYGVSQ